MTYLVLSILFSTLTVSFFKVFERKNVDTFQAIVFNYLGCSILGNLVADETIFRLPFTLLLGLGLVLFWVFYSFLFFMPLPKPLKRLALQPVWVLQNYRWFYP